MPVKYTRELLAEAAAAATTLDEMLIALGREPNQYNRSYLRQRIKAYGINASHFPEPGTFYTKELLQEAVAASHSVAGVIRHLNRRQPAAPRPMSDAGSRPSGSTPPTSPEWLTTAASPHLGGYRRRKFSFDARQRPSECPAFASAGPSLNSADPSCARTAALALSGAEGR
ncbi:hypothetical protein ACFZDG_28690 [Kitasatospora xanthocidica]|uniref:hypothetical protein n=1 Tax=Kitasatospora xanthocidica TaxID=83382 RepID=UPI0036EDA5E8